MCGCMCVCVYVCVFIDTGVGKPTYSVSEM